jgi:outer membrane protein assembly factor BamB
MKKVFFLLLFLTFSVVLSACAGGTGVATSWPGVAADETTAYLTSNQHVFAIDLANGTEKWRFPAQADNKISFYASPALTPDGQLLAGGYNHVLYSLDPATGTVNWSFSGAKDRYVGSPLATEAGIFAPNADGTLYALDHAGKQLWTFKTERAQWSKPVSDPECECIYLASMDHHLYSLDAQTGELKWKSDALGGALVGTPAYGDPGVLYVGSFNKEMLAIDAETGKLSWQTPFKTTNWVWGGPALTEDRLYFGDLSGTFYGLNAADGSPAWDPLNPGGSIAESPTVSGDTIYFVTETGTLYGVDTSGQIKVNKTIGGKLYTSPVLTGDTLLLAPVGAESPLYALDLNGVEKWKFTPEEK